MTEEIDYCECGCMLVSGVPVDEGCGCLTEFVGGTDTLTVEMPEDEYAPTDTEYDQW